MKMKVPSVLVDWILEELLMSAKGLCLSAWTHLNYQYIRSSKPAFLTLFSEFMSPCPFSPLSSYLLFIPTAGLPWCPCKPVYQCISHVPVDNHNPMIWVPFETSVLLCQLPLTKKCRCVFYLPPSLFWKFTPKYISSQLQSLYRDLVQRH